MDSLIREIARDNSQFLQQIEDVKELHRVLDRLVAIRRGLDLTQTDVARRMGVTQPTVSAFEREDSNPRVETLQRYARAVGVKLELDVKRPLTVIDIFRARPDAWTWRKQGRAGFRVPA